MYFQIYFRFNDTCASLQESPLLNKRSLDFFGSLGILLCNYSEFCESFLILPEA